MGQILAKEYIARKYKEEAPGLVFFSRKHQLYRIEGRWITRKEFHAVLREAKDALASDQAQPSSIEAAPPADLPPDYVSPQLGVIEKQIWLEVLRAIGGTAAAPDRRGTLDGKEKALKVCLTEQGELSICPWEPGLRALALAYLADLSHHSDTATAQHHSDAPPPTYAHADDSAPLPQRRLVPPV